MRKFLPAHLSPSAQTIFRTYGDYKEAFLNFGGMIEATPKVNSKSIGLACFIEPDGEFSIISHYEKVVVDKLTIGYITPQKIIPFKV